MKIKKIGGFIVLLLVTFQALAQNENYQKEMFIKGADTLKYRVMYPKNFSDTDQYPVVFFLHGAGERGNDNESQLAHGSSLFANAESLENFPAIVVFPQCPTEDYWSNAKIKRQTRPISLKFKYNRAPTKAMNMVMQLVDEMVGKPFAKENQVYIMGLSMGGMGTYELLYRKPETFAAAIAICGGGDEKKSKDFARKVPLWIFHGAKDDVVDPQLSLKMASAIMEYGGQPNVTLFSDANHNSWDPAFAEPALLPWLFTQKK
ncbi:prolyl oligopeptidase family serine peptidase [Cellulophaga sp. Z1A5H]|uniref:carboxylesterase family protein n=1 Tax=Cellulophaga sp. Z1A5H TaxID=2687291 RepID=UPI0013FDC2EF|nr:prolyl oligopeptidase family serine peptidase [Cellulophaga sp. Z1A5H]